MFQFGTDQPHALYDMRNHKTSGRQMFIYPRGGQVPDLGEKPAWPSSLMYEGFPLHEDPAYINMESAPNHLYVWGLRFLKKRLLEPVTISIQYHRNNEIGYIKDNSKYLFLANSQIFVS